jgi:hypothetical protein
MHLFRFKWVNSRFGRGLAVYKVRRQNKDQISHPLLQRHTYVGNARECDFWQTLEPSKKGKPALATPYVDDAPSTLSCLGTEACEGKRTACKADFIRANYILEKGSGSPLCHWEPNSSVCWEEKCSSVSLAADLASCYATESCTCGLVFLLGGLYCDSHSGRRCVSYPWWCSSWVLTRTAQRYWSRD